MTNALSSALLLAANLQVHAKWGLAEQAQTQRGIRPMVRTGQGEMKSALEDFHHSLSYVRCTAPIRIVAGDGMKGCDDTERRTCSYRIVVVAKRTDGICEDLTGALLTAQSAIKTADLKGAIGADIVTVTSVGIDSDGLRVVSSEAPGLDLPLEWAMGYIDLTIEVIGEPECFTNC